MLLSSPPFSPPDISGRLTWPCDYAGLGSLEMTTVTINNAPALVILSPAARGVEETVHRGWEPAHPSKGNSASKLVIPPHLRGFYLQYFRCHLSLLPGIEEQGISVRFQNLFYEVGTLLSPSGCHSHVAFLSQIWWDATLIWEGLFGRCAGNDMHLGEWLECCPGSSHLREGKLFPGQAESMM